MLPPSNVSSTKCPSTGKCFLKLNMNIYLAFVANGFIRFISNYPYLEQQVIKVFVQSVIHSEWRLTSAILAFVEFADHHSFQTANGITLPLPRVSITLQNKFNSGAQNGTSSAQIQKLRPLFHANYQLQPCHAMPGGRDICLVRLPLSDESSIDINN